MLARSDDAIVLPLIVLGIIVALFGWAGVLWLRERIWPRQVGRRLQRFVGRPLDKLEIHEKNYPGYDLASINLALTSLQEEVCDAAVAVGALGHALHDVISGGPTSYAYKQKPTKENYERLPVDVEREESFVANGLWFFTLRPGASGRGERVALHLSYRKGSAVHDEDFETKATKGSSLSVTVACASRAVADLLFNEIEARRKRLSIYRGKVVDPVMDGGGIQALGFRKIKPVGEQDLVLPDSVKSLVQRSVVGF